MKLLIVLVVVGVVLSGCGLFAGAKDPEIVYGEAQVDQISIEILESFPVQVRVVAIGYLVNPCTPIDHVEQSRNGNDFNIKIITAHKLGIACINMIEPFERAIMLDVEGLPAGIYTLNVNGLSDSFELSVDNVRPGQN